MVHQKVAFTLPETNSSPLKWMVGRRWFLLGQMAYFQVLLLLVSGRVAFSGLLSRARDMTSKPPTHHRIQKYQFSCQFVQQKLEKKMLILHPCTSSKIIRGIHGKPLEKYTKKCWVGCSFVVFHIYGIYRLPGSSSSGSLSGLRVGGLRFGKMRRVPLGLNVAWNK